MRPTGPANPLSDAELEHKFTLNATRALPQDRVALLSDVISRLEDLDNLEELLQHACRD